MSETIKYIIQTWRNIQYHRHMAGQIEDDDFANCRKLVAQASAELQALEAKAATFDVERFVVDVPKAPDGEG